jgi:hypothetical protein
VNSESGYIVVPARSSAASWSVAFYKLESNTLRPAVTVDVTAQGDADKITGVECVLTDNGGVPETGLTQQAAKDKFCAEPAVKGIFQ